MNARVAGVILLSALSAQAATERIDSRADVKTWYAYYDRALQRMDAEDWTSAESDLRAALGWRARDTDRARTYGVHFIQYYANRELGIVLYRTQRLEEAEQHLEASYRDAPTDRAAYYLNVCRRARLLASGEDVAPPEIALEAQPPTMTRALEIFVRGTAVDDQYVSELRVGGRAVRIPVSVPQAPFAAAVPLRHGSMALAIDAVDLVGRHTRRVWPIIVDHQGPTLAVERLGLTADDEYELEAVAYDAGQVHAVLIAGATLHEGEATAARVFIRAPRLPEQEFLEVELRDGLGNITRCDLDLRAPIRSGQAPPRSLWRWCARDDAAGAVSPGPRIELQRLPGRPVFVESMYLDGSVRDACGVAEVTFNGEVLDLPAGTDLFFSRRTPLALGVNTLVLDATNARGMTSRVVVEIVRESGAHALGAERAAVGALPFEGGEAAARVFRSFESELARRNRFQLVSRDQLDLVLLEQRLAASKLIAAGKRIVPRLIPAELLVAAEVEQRGDGLEAFLWVVDVATGLCVVPINAFVPEEGDAAARRLAEKLALLMEDEFPLVEGEVIAVDRQGLWTSLGRYHRLRPHARLSAFRLGAELYDSNGAYCGRARTPLPELVVRDVQERQSRCAPLSGARDAEAFQRGDVVRTR